MAQSDYILSHFFSKNFEEDYSDQIWQPEYDVDICDACDAVELQLKNLTVQTGGGVKRKAQNDEDETCVEMQPGPSTTSGNNAEYHGQGMDAAGSNFDSGQQPAEQELATKMLQIQSKRFYLDVKQNRRGRFIKVAEIGADGRRSQIFLAMSTAAEFRDHLSSFSDYYSSLGPPNQDNVPDDGKLKSEMMLKDNRRYYLDLKENSRGRFLRVSQTITRGGPRSQVALPAQGMIEFRDALTDLLDEYGTDDGGYKGELPEGRHLRVDNKNFYFDIGQNNRGIYMKVSEVKSNFRTAITVPEKCWARFRDIMADYCDKMSRAQQASPDNLPGPSGAAGASGGSSRAGALAHPSRDIDTFSGPAPDRI